MMWRLALRELLFARAKLRLVFAVLVIGFLGPILSSALRSSVDAYLNLRSRQILAADLALSALRPLTQAERDAIREVVRPVREAQETEFATMGRGKDSSTLIEVKAVSASFPLMGRFETRDGRIIESAAALDQGAVAWVFPEVLAQLGLKEGDVIGLGRAEFRIAEVLVDGPGLTRGGAFAPRLYIGLSQLELTGLTGFGSQVFHRTYLELPKDLMVATAQARIKSALQDPDIFFRTPEDSTAGLERFFNFFNLYLVSISMIVFALSWVSAFYILQVFLQERLRSAAVLLTFGASRMVTALIPAVQVFALMAGALLVSFGLVGLAIFALPSLLSSGVPAGLQSGLSTGQGAILPRGFVLFIGASDLFRMLVVAGVSTVTFTLPFFVRFTQLKLLDLLSESAMSSERLSRRASVFTYGSLALIFMGLSAWLMQSLMQSWRNALFITGGILLAALLGWVVARGAFRLFFGLARSLPGLTRLVATQLVRSRFGMNLCFITLFVVALVLNLVPHLLHSAEEEILPLKGREIPSLFLFNVPESDVERLKMFSAERNLELRNLAPMVQARLLKVNGVQTKIDQFLRFPVRLSYRDSLIDSERIVEAKSLESKSLESKSLESKSLESKSPESKSGVAQPDRSGSSADKQEKFLSGASDASGESGSLDGPGEKSSSVKLFSGMFDPASSVPAEISVEKEWAERNEIKLGDEIEFDIQGVPLVGQVTSVRSVRWANFAPNFFLVVQPGVLEDAPKTFLANINIGGDREARERAKVSAQFQIVRDFPNLNVIDVGRTLDRALEVIRSILGPVRVAAWIAIVMSFLILVGVIAHNLRMRESEVDVMKVFGADAGFIRRLFVSEYALSAAFAALLGAGAAMLISWQVVARLFEIALRPAFGALFLSILVVILTTSAITFVACSRILRLRGASRKL